VILGDVESFRDPRLRLRLRDPGVAWRRVVDDIVVLDVDRSHYHAINPSGALIWEQLAEGATVGALSERLVGVYPDAVEQVQADLPTFLAALGEAGLIEIDTEGSVLEPDRS
jgi:hypothetical protein